MPAASPAARGSLKAKRVVAAAKVIRALGGDIPVAVAVSLPAVAVNLKVAAVPIRRQAAVLHILPRLVRLSTLRPVEEQLRTREAADSFRPETTPRPSVVRT
jgi:hypothetical protein